MSPSRTDVKIQEHRYIYTFVFVFCYNLTHVLLINPETNSASAPVLMRTEMTSLRHSFSHPRQPQLGGRGAD